MNEYTRRRVRLLLSAALFLFFLWLIISGQRTVSYPALGRMVAGLAGILTLLYRYNRSWTAGDKQGDSRHG